MPILFHEKTRTFTLQTKDTTYQMQVGKYDYLLHLYYGKKVEDTSLSYLIQSIDRGFSGNPYEADKDGDRSFSLDTLPQEYSTFGVGDFRTSCLQVENEDGSQTIDLKYVSHKIYPNKYVLEGLPALWGDESSVESLEIELEDGVTGVNVTLLYSVIEAYDSITRAVKIKNQKQEYLYLNKALSMGMDFLENSYDFITFYGRHSMERMMERRSVTHGRITIDSVRGTSSHHENPFMILCDKNANEEYGACYGMALVYSGNFLGEVEVDQINQTRVNMGINATGFRYKLEKGETFVTPEVVLGFSGMGFTKLSQNYHHVYQKHLIRSKYVNQRRPILINNWEATYFDFDDKKLIEIAKEAKDMGIELFVMDDGWFGKRDNDHSGLGDWVVNTNKIKCGIKGLAEEINKIGMKFGIWIEPEMVNEDSDLCRKHPDWYLKAPNRKAAPSRSQYVLDLSREDVREYLFESIRKVLDTANIEYVKWDMNRNLTDVWSALLPNDRQGEVYHRYVLGLYSLLEKFITQYPDILFEGCSGGGGRFDAGMLYYMPQSWCSDNTDAIERIRIQYGTSFGYPISSIGSHVSESPNHQTGRETSLKTRGIVAMAGTFGYELDVTKMKQEDKELVKKQIEAFKKYYDIIQFGAYFRLSNPMENRKYAAWQFVTEDRKKSLLSVVLLHKESNEPFVRMKLKGLDEANFYQINGESRIYSGSALMNAGIVVPYIMGDNQSINFEIEAVHPNEEKKSKYSKEIREG